MADLEREIWDWIGAREVTRAQLAQEFPRVSPEALQVKIGALKRRCLLKEAIGSGISRVQDAKYTPAFVSIAKPGPAPTRHSEIYGKGARVHGPPPPASLDPPRRESTEHAGAAAAGGNASPPSQEGGVPATAAPAPRPRAGVMLVSDTRADDSEDDSGISKPCISCGESKPLTEFGFRGRGRSRICKACSGGKPAPAPTPVDATTNDDNEPGETTMPADSKKCPQCKQTKPKDDFRKHQRRCNACLDSGADQEKPAAKPARKPKRAARKKAAKRATPARRTNGAVDVERDHAFTIPAGREIKVDVIRGVDGVRQLELTAREPGKDPDQFLNLTRDQAVALHGFLGQLLVE